MIALKIPANGHRLECIAKPAILQAWVNVDGKTVLNVSQLTFHLLSKCKLVTTQETISVCVSMLLPC